MNFKRKTLCVALAGVAGIGAGAGMGTAQAGTDVWFNPLTQSAYVGIPNHLNEKTAPWVMPAGITVRNLTSLSEVEASINQSMIRAPGAGNVASMIDMVQFDRTGKFLFLPHETPWGAGVSRYDIENDVNETLFQGDSNGRNGDWTNDYGAFDPALVTPQGTVWAAEEWAGEGRVVEILNPEAAPADIQIRELESIANVAHEGLRFGRDNRTLYFVDEWNSGSIYKIVFKDKKDYALGGQTFVLAVEDYKGNPADNFNEASNVGQPRVGAATWVPITDVEGKPLTTISPFRNGPSDDPRTSDVTRGGRPAADEVNGTPYGRPEDLEVGKLRNGNEVVYVAATSERTIYAIEMTGATKAVVRVFADDANTPKNWGFNPTTAVMNSPDNLETDALGNIYIIEDSPNEGSEGGDVWFARDINNDGVAESIYQFLSLGVNTSEATGMEFNPAKNTEFVVAVQHPQSTDLDVVPGGFGDAVWAFDVSGVVPPPCEFRRAFDPVTGQRVLVPVQRKETRTCFADREVRFVKRLEKAKVR